MPNPVHIDDHKSVEDQNAEADIRTRAINMASDEKTRADNKLADEKAAAANKIADKRSEEKRING